jgi:hypothetical protein
MTDTTSERGGDDAEVRAVRRARTLPGGRAVVGGLLVAAAAVGVFAAYLDAVAEPTTRYLVARADLEPGTRFESMDTVAASFESRAVDLAPDLAARAVRLEDAELLLGRLLLAPLQPGQLLAPGDLVADGGVADAHKLSFAVEPSAALAGDLRVGERLDVLATYGSGDGAYTVFVVRGVPLVARSGAGGSSGLGSGGGPLTLTVAVTSPEDVQALAHAVATADIVVTRSTVAEGDARPAPGAYEPSRDRPGPAPDPAGDPVGTSGPDSAPDPAADGSETGEAPEGATETGDEG